MRIDEVGYWTEIKLDILREYAEPYSQILRSKEFTYWYIDAFAGAGKHISRRTGEEIPGSPLNALNVEPSFDKFHFIDMDKERANIFAELAENNSKILAYHGDCNDILVNEIFPTLQYSSYKRALCLLDPYGLTLRWDTIKSAGKLGTIDIFINFPVMDINRNVLSKNLASADPEDVRRMNELWGDETWQDKMYCETMDLFGDTQQIKIDNYYTLAKEFRSRLKKDAGFKFVPEPVLMRNKTGGPLYYLFFASQQDVASKIIKSIFDKYRKLQLG